MTPLALTVPVTRWEIPTSYLSRVAPRNLSPDLWTFCQDMGLDFAAISTGDTVAVAHLCALAGIPADSFRNRTVLKTSTMKYRLGAEVMNTETLSRGEIRFCPCCVADALLDVNELHWQFIHIQQCRRHGVMLQSYRTKADKASRFDFTAFVRDVGSDFFLCSQAVREEADVLDLYLTARAYGEHDENWYNRLEIPALIKACEACGVSVDHGSEKRAFALSACQRRDAMLTGFRILSAGPAGIHQALDRFSGRTPTRCGQQPHPSIGEVQRLLGSHAKQRVDLDPVRDIVREYFLDHFPFQPGMMVLGEKLAETRVFSLRGACREVGIRRSILEAILIRRRLAHRGEEGQFQLEVVLTPALIDDISREKQDYLDQNQTAKVLGCSFAMFKQLQRSGILRPEEGDRRRMRKGFHRAALQEFLNRLGTNAARVTTARPHLCALDLATRKANCSVPEIVSLMLDGKLCARARLTDELRLDSLLVEVTEIMRVLCPVEPNGYSLSEVRRRLFINAATLEFLIERNLLEVRRFRHNITRVTRDYVTAESLARFATSYTTLGMFACENGLSGQALRSLLCKVGLKSITTVCGMRKVYPRREVEALCQNSGNITVLQPKRTLSTYGPSCLQAI